MRILKIVKVIKAFLWALLPLFIFCHCSSLKKEEKTFSQMQLQTERSAASSKELKEYIISPKDFYFAKADTFWIDCGFFPCWDNMAAIQTRKNNSDELLSFYYLNCEGDDPGDPCDLMAKEWMSNLDNGKEMVIVYDGSGVFIELFQFRNPSVESSPADASSPPEENGP